MIYLILASLVWAFSYGLIKGNLTGLSPDFIAFARMAVPLILFIPFFKCKSLSLKKTLAFLAIGAIQYGFMYLFVIRSYQYLPAYQVVLFTACTPIYVTLINDAFSKSFNPFYLVTATMALLGGAFLYYKNLKWDHMTQGFILVQLSDLCFAFGQVAYKRLMKGENELKDRNLYALLFLGGALVTSLSTTMFNGWGSLSALSLKQSVLLLYLGAIASGLCFFFWNKAAKTTNAGTLAVFNNLKIPLGIFVSLVVFGEESNIPRLLLSGSVMALALFLSERHSKKKTSLTELKTT